MYFLPAGRSERAYKDDSKFITVQNFEKFIHKLPLLVRIDFSGMSEPWANPWATDMLDLALGAGFHVAIYTTLSGLKLKDSDRVIDLLTQKASQIDVLCLHLPDNLGNMPGFRPSEDYNVVLSKFIAPAELNLLTDFQIMTIDGSGQFHTSIQDLGMVPSFQFNGITRADLIDHKYVGLKEARKNNFALSCASTPFYDHNTLLPNGDVALCFMDYALKHIIGNLHEHSYYELFGGPTITQLRIENQKLDFSMCSICKQCENVVSLDRYYRP